MMLPFSLFLAFLTTLITVIFLNRIAPSIGLVDHPSERKVHTSKTPVTGGISIAIGITLTTLLTLQTIPNDFLWILGGALCMVFTGAYDDLKNLPVTHRFLIQALVASVTLIGADIQIESIGDYPFIGEIQLGVFSYPVTLFAILTGINAINLIDGLDGLASGIGVVAFSCISVLAFVSGATSLSFFSGIIAMSLVGFLLKNMRFPWQASAKAFLGDAGSTALGFTLACFIIKAASIESPLIAPTTALWLLAIPLIDTLSVMLRRIGKGEPAFKASRDHLHHILLRRHGSVGYSVSCILATSLALTLTGLALGHFTNDVTSLVAFSLVTCIYHFSLKQADRSRPTPSKQMPVEEAAPVKKASKSQEAA